MDGRFVFAVSVNSKQTLKTASKNHTLSAFSIEKSCIFAAVFKQEISNYDQHNIS